MIGLQVLSDTDLNALGLEKAGSVKIHIIVLWLIPGGTKRIPLSSALSA